MLFGLLAPKDVPIIWLSNLLIMSVPDEDYSKKRALRTKLDIYVLIHNKNAESMSSSINN